MLSLNCKLDQINGLFTGFIELINSLKQNFLALRERIGLLLDKRNIINVICHLLQYGVSKRNISDFLEKILNVKMHHALISSLVAEYDENCARFHREFVEAFMRAMDNNAVLQIDD